MIRNRFLKDPPDDIDPLAALDAADPGKLARDHARWTALAIERGLLVEVPGGYRGTHQDAFA